MTASITFMLGLQEPRRYHTAFLLSFKRLKLRALEQRIVIFITSFYVMQVVDEPRRIRDLIELADDKGSKNVFRRIRSCLQDATTRRISFVGKEEVEVFPVDINPETFAGKLKELVNEVVDGPDELKKAALWTVYDEVSGYISTLDRKDLTAFLRE